MSDRIRSTSDARFHRVTGQRCRGRAISLVRVLHRRGRRLDQRRDGERLQALHQTAGVVRHDDQIRRIPGDRLDVRLEPGQLRHRGFGWDSSTDRRRRRPDPRRRSRTASPSPSRIARRSARGGAGNVNPPTVTGNAPTLGDGAGDVEVGAFAAPPAAVSSPHAGIARTTRATNAKSALRNMHILLLSEDEEIFRAAHSRTDALQPRTVPSARSRRPGSPSERASQLRDSAGISPDFADFRTTSGNPEASAT